MADVSADVELVPGGLVHVLPMRLTGHLASLER